MTPEAPPPVGLITIWYQAGAAIDRFAAELAAQRYPDLRAVFVIHSLRSDEVAHLRAAVPHAVILEPGANLGPAAGWNLAIRTLLQDEVRYIGMLNVDTHLDERCIERLVFAMQATPSIGACQPLLCDSADPQRVQMFGGSLNLETGNASHDFRGAYFSRSLPATRDAGYLDGGSMLVRASVFRAVHGFDEGLFMYAEDCDLSVRIQRAGYRTVAVRNARAWHDHSDSGGRLPPAYEVFYRTRNRFLLVRRYADTRAWLSLIARALVWELPRVNFFYLRRGRADLARAHSAGIVHGVLGHVGKQGWVI